MAKGPRPANGTRILPKVLDVENSHKNKNNSNRHGKDASSERKTTPT